TSSSHIRKTSGIGASKWRTINNSSSRSGMPGSAGARGSVLASILVSLGELGEIIVHPVETALPEAAILAEPAIEMLQRRRIEPAGSPLRLTPARDQPGRFEHLEVARDRRKADIE